MRSHENSKKVKLDLSIRNILKRSLEYLGRDLLKCVLNLHGSLTWLRSKQKIQNCPCAIKFAVLVI